MTNGGHYTFSQIEEEFCTAAEHAINGKDYDHALQFLLLAAEINLEEGEISLAAEQYSSAIAVALSLYMEREQYTYSNEVGALREFIEVLSRLCSSIQNAVERGDITCVESLYRDLTTDIRESQWRQNSQFILRYLRPIRTYLTRGATGLLWPTVIRAWRRNRLHRKRLTRLSSAPRSYLSKGVSKRYHE